VPCTRRLGAARTRTRSPRASTRMQERESTRPEKAAHEQGSALVELAMVVPFLLLLLFGITQFGMAYSDSMALRQGVREAARQGSVGNFGPTYTVGDPCHLTGAATASDNVKNLMCLAKGRIGLDASKVRVKVLSGSPDFTGTGAFAKADSIIVCAQFKLESVTGLFAEVVDSAYLRSKTSMRIELTDIVASPGEETPPAGSDWSWCTVQSVSP
jgi:hypothetical protein